MIIRMMMMIIVSRAFTILMLRRDDCYHGEERRESVPESVGSAGRGDLIFTLTSPSLTSTSSRLFIDIIIIIKILITNNMEIFSSIRRRPLLSLSVSKQESSEQFLIAPGGIWDGNLRLKLEMGTWLVLGKNHTIPHHILRWDPHDHKFWHQISSCHDHQVSVDSPRISFSPLQIKGSIEEEETWFVNITNINNNNKNSYMFASKNRKT